jgi:hypothetical protein
MEEQPGNPPTISRRKILAGLAATAGVSAVVAGGAYGLTELVKSTQATALQPDLRSAFIDERVPADDPESGLWGRATAQRIAIQGQNVIVPFKPEPAVTEIVARSLHDGATIAFLLEWHDPELDEHTIKIDAFRDACGVFLGPFPPNPALWTMGAPDNPVTILHWKADWQKDIDAGFQDLEVAFPNVSFEFYPPLVGVTNPKIPDDYPEEVRNRLPGWFVGNPMSQPIKTTPVQKLRAIGPGTIEELDTQNAAGKGIWKNGKWKVTLAKPMQAADADETAITAGSSYSLAFTVWSGTAHDRGSRKSLTQLGQLVVEARG